MEKVGTVCVHRCMRDYHVADIVGRQPCTAVATCPAESETGTCFVVKTMDV